MNVKNYVVPLSFFFTSASKTVENIESDVNYAKYCKKVDEMENFPVELFFLLNVTSSF